METSAPRSLNLTRYNPRLKSVTILLLISTLLSTGLLNGGGANAQIDEQARSSPQGRWWNTAWQLRTPLMVMNSLNESIVDQPIFVYLEVPGSGSIISAARELRFVNSAGIEMPSYILHEQREDGFVRSVYLLAFVTLKPNDAALFDIYYGNPDAAEPWYRFTKPTEEVLKSGDVNIQLKDLIYRGAEINILYGDHYSLDASTRISYGTAEKRNYGSPEVATMRFTDTRDWTSFGNMTIYSSAGASAELQAGDIALVRSILLRGEDLWIADLITNEGTKPISDINYNFLLNASRLTAYGIPYGEFNQASGLANIAIGGTYIGVKNYDPTQRFQISSNRLLIDNLRQERLDMSHIASGLFSMAFSRETAVLKTGQLVEHIRVISSDSDISRLTSKLERFVDAVKTYTLQEESLRLPIPRVTIGYDISLKMTDITLSAQGSNISLKNVPRSHGAVYVTGQMRYQLLSEEDSSFDRSTIWKASNNRSGTAGSIALSSNWQDPVKELTGYISVWDNAGKGQANASLTSSWLLVPSSATSANLTFAYRARYVSNVSDPQTLYLAVYVDRDLDELQDQSIILPVKNSGTLAEGSGGRTLLGDGVWRQISVDVTSLLKGENNALKIKLFSSSKQGFQGKLELGIDDLQVQVESSANRLVKASINDNPSRIEIQLNKNIPNSLTAGNLNITFFTVDSRTLSGLPNGLFRSSFTQPSTETFISSNKTENLAVSRRFLTLNSGSLNDLLYVKLGEVTLEPQDLQIQGERLYVVKSVLAKIQDDLLGIDAGFKSEAIDAKVVDAGGKPVSGVLVLLKDRLSQQIFSNKTDASGMVHFETMSSEYRLQFYYHNELLSEITEKIPSKTPLNIRLPLYEIQFKTVGQIGIPISGASVNLAIDNGTVLVSSQTDSNGQTQTMHVIGKKPYTALVYADGNQVLKRAVVPSLNGMTVLFNTQYIPVSLALMIMVLLVSVATVTVLAMRRKLPKMQKMLQPQQV